MSMVVDNVGVKPAFQSKWITVYVPAIIEYMKASNRQFITLLAQMDAAGMYTYNLPLYFYEPDVALYCSHR